MRDLDAVESSRWFRRAESRSEGGSAVESDKTVGLAGVAQSNLVLLRMLRWKLRCGRVQIQIPSWTLLESILPTKQTVQSSLHALHILLFLFFVELWILDREVWQVVGCACLTQLAVGELVENLVDFFLSLFFHLVFVFAEHARVERIVHQLFHDAGLAAARQRQRSSRSVQVLVGARV